MILQYRQKMLGNLYGFERNLLQKNYFYLQ